MNKNFWSIFDYTLRQMPPKRTARGRTKLSCCQRMKLQTMFDVLAWMKIDEDDEYSWECREDYLKRIQRKLSRG